jgi:hypothetical protein
MAIQISVSPTNVSNNGGAQFFVVDWGAMIPGANTISYTSPELGTQTATYRRTRRYIGVVRLVLGDGMVSTKQTSPSPSLLPHASFQSTTMNMIMYSNTAACLEPLLVLHRTSKRGNSCC